MKSASTQDGVFAWLLCSMSFLSSVIIGSFISTSGMFFLMFKNALDVSDSEIALITSIHIAVMHGIGPFTGVLCERFGSRCVAVVGGIISTAALACCASSTLIIHLYISYGVLAGAGQGVMNIIMISVLDPYFHKYKRTACGVALAGYGVGSIISPPMVKFLEDTYGWRGAILLMAGMNAQMVVTCSFFRPFEDAPQFKQNPASNGVRHDTTTQCAELNLQLTNSIKNKYLEMLSLFRVKSFLCLSACALIIIFPISIITTHYGSYLITLQYTSEDVVKLYMTLGVGATVARPLAGVVAEVTNVNSAMYIMVTNLLNGALTMFVPLMKKLWMMYMYAVIYQLLMGPYLALGASTIMEHVPKTQVTTAYGIYFFFCVPGYILGAPIGVWLYDYTQVYAHSFYLAGSLIILSGLMMVPAAFNINKPKHEDPESSL